jgi:hypothetical protein
VVGVIFKVEKNFDQINLNKLGIFEVRFGLVEK